MVRNDNTCVIILIDSFGGYRGAITCTQGATKLRIAFEEAAIKHGVSENEGGDYISYLLAYITEDLKKFITGITCNTKIAEV